MKRFLLCLVIIGCIAAQGNASAQHLIAYLSQHGLHGEITFRQASRCVAGGYVWNPFYTQLADPLNRDLYEQECGPDNPLHCYVGDLSGRLGTIDLGGDRVVLTDSNLPLGGPVSAIGRSIVIFGPNNSAERFACANIEPDHT